MVWHSDKLKLAVSQSVFICGLLAIVVFVGGPQMGALDLDRDGFPEVSIAVASARSITNFSRSLQKPQLALNHVVLTLTMERLLCFALPVPELALRRHPSDSRLLCVLRC